MAQLPVTSASSSSPETHLREPEFPNESNIFELNITFLKQVLLQEVTL